MFHCEGGSCAIFSRDLDDVSGCEGAQISEYARTPIRCVDVPEQGGRAAFTRSGGLDSSMSVKSLPAPFWSEPRQLEF